MLPRRPATTSRSSEVPCGARLFDRYVVGERIGRGGMAVAHRAFDERLQRAVCIKILRSPAEEGRSLSVEAARVNYAHFVQEAFALSRLAHPNTLRIFDLGHLPDGRPFQVSELLDGGSLASRVHETGPVGADEALAILGPIVGAVREAHHQGIVHRDIKPANILFASVGKRMVPKLADFGIAHRIPGRALEGGRRLLEPAGDVLLFSPRWAAPEQIAGLVEGPATDVYALALLVHFMLTGRALFDDADVSTTFRARLAGGQLAQKRLAASGFGPALFGALAAALDLEPTRRPSDAGRFLDALASALRREIPFSGLPAAAPAVARATHRELRS